MGVTSNNFDGLNKNKRTTATSTTSITDNDGGGSSGTSSSHTRTIINERWVLTQHPNGSFEPTRDVKLVQESIVLDQKGEGKDLSTYTCSGVDNNNNDSSSNIDQSYCLVEVDTLSVDAFIRTMLDANKGAYHGGLSLGDTIPAIGYGKVIATGSQSGWKVGQSVMGMLGAQTYASRPGRSLQHNTVMNLQQLLPQRFVPSPTASLGLLGLTTGLTAYVGIFYVCKPPRRGETVVITASAGAVGSVAAQLAKWTGAKVVGIAGNKNEYLINDLQLDGAINYKVDTQYVGPSLGEQLDAVCPDGVDFVFDNVGGDTLDVLLQRIRPGGRIVICGAVSQYDSPPDMSNNPGKENDGKNSKPKAIQGPSQYLKLAERGATMRGFNVLQYSKRFPIAVLMLIWLSFRGKVHMTEQIEVGIQTFPYALQKLFTGGNTGKLLVQVKQHQPPQQKSQGWFDHQ